MQSFTLDPNEQQEVTYISGIAANGTLAAQSFWTWNNDDPATYGSQDDEAKYGALLAGAGSGEITFSFNASSNWTASEQSAFEASMALWSEVANVHFEQVATGGDFTITRGSDGSAEAGTTELYPGTVGGATLGQPVKASLSIDTSVGGFGPLGGPFNEYGGYPWTTMIHELGHILGLGHSGAYDEGVTTTDTALTPDDNRAFSIMSYLDPPANPYDWTITSVSGAREEGLPVTPQELDILALERIYGLPTTTPLSGGQTFGFNCNIQGPTEPFFDFTQNSQPIVTLWDEGTGNTLDASGFAEAQTINLQSGAFSSIGGLTDNVAIALGTQIDHAVGGTGADLLMANSDNDTLVGGLDDDTIIAGSGQDQLYGNGGDDDIVLGASSGAATVYGGQGDDVIDASASIQSNFISADVGDDSLVGGHGDDTLYGGDGADTIVSGSAQDQIYGNAGDDHILLGASSGGATVYGGQGNDIIDASASTHSNFISADLGDDSLVGGHSDDTLYGGDGADTLLAGSGHDQLYGNAGDDYIDVGAGSQGATIYGGQGDDTIDASSATHAVLISGDVGNDIILGSKEADTIHGGEGSDTIEAASGSIEHIHVGLSDSSALPGAGVAELDHITGFGSGDFLVFDGDPAGTAANTVIHGSDASIADFTAAYTYAYGDGMHAAAILGGIEYAVVGDTAGHVYVFAADHASVELDGLSGGVAGVTLGQLLAA